MRAPEKCQHCQIESMVLESINTTDGICTYFLRCGKCGWSLAISVAVPITDLKYGLKCGGDSSCGECGGDCH